MRIKPPKIIRRLFPTFIWNFPDEKDGIFLTFDDGPCQRYTGELLDIDAVCGGYNLTIAWITGMLAGIYIGELC